MKRLTALLVIIVLLGCFSSASADENNKIRVQYQIFKFSGDLAGETHEDGEIWTTGEAPDKLKDRVKVFSRGKFKIGKGNLEFKKGRCFWKDQEIPITGLNGVKIPRRHLLHMGSTQVTMQEHSSGGVSLETKQPIQYFEKRSDGLFVLKQI